MTVATMLAELAKHNWPNDTKHRAGVTGELRSKTVNGRDNRPVKGGKSPHPLLALHPARSRLVTGRRADFSLDVIPALW